MIGRSFSPFAMQLGSAGTGKGAVSFLFAVLLLAQSMVLVTPEIVDMGLDMIIEASSDSVHFIQANLMAPATIDLSNIRWISNEQLSFELYDDAATYDYDFEQDDEFEALKTDPPIRGSEDFQGNNDNAPGEGNEDDGQDDEGEITGEGNDANDEEQKEDPVVPSEDEINSNEDKEGGDIESESENETPAEPSPPVTEPEDEQEGESVENNDTPQGNNEQDKGKDESEGETTNEAQNNKNNQNKNNNQNQNKNNNKNNNNQNKNNNQNNNQNQNQNKNNNQNSNSNSNSKNNNSSGDTNVEAEEEKEGPADKDDKEATPPVPEKEDATPVAPSGDNNDNGGDENDQEEEVATPVDEQEGESRPAAPSEDQNDKGGNKDEQEGEESTPVDEQEGESTPAAPSENQNGNGGNKDQQEGESRPAAPSGDQNDKGGNKDEQEGEESTPSEGRDPTLPPTNEGTTFPPTSAPGDDAGNRSLQYTNNEQIVDIALFIERPNCAKDEWGNCEWVSVGIGAYDSEMVGGMSYCCNDDTAKRGLCNRENIGHMMVDHDKFDKVNGDHRKVKVPSTPLEDFEMEDPLFEVKESGSYIMIIANCDDDGLDVITLGNMEWKSVNGYLPGDMFYLMYFFGATTVVYLVLGLWYYSFMRMYQEAAIPIQKYFLATIIFGFHATGFQELSLIYWNVVGVQSPALMWIALALGTLFQASLSCLGVMVAKGWGVVRDTLGLTFFKIILLGLLYFGLALVRDFLQLASSSASLVSTKQEESKLAQVLTLVIFCINVRFYFWIINSARATAEYLKNMNQTSKLRRHLHLRRLIITSMIISVALTGANAIQAMSGPLFPYPVQSIMSQDQVWIIKAMGYANYLFILIGVTILWRPTADSKDYAMQMQIPTGNEENDLELSCVVPSADDMGMNEGFTIHDAVRT